MISSTIVAIALIVGSVSSVSARSSLSSQCQSTFFSLAASPEASCLNLAGFIPFFSIDRNASLVAPINTWSTDFCSQSACTNQSLATVFETLIPNCSQGLVSGQTNYTVESVIETIQSIYPTARKMACFKDTSVDQLCLTELFTRIEDRSGTLASDSFASVVLTLLVQPNPADSAFVTRGACSHCGQQMYHTLNDDFPGVLTSDDDADYQNLCGTSFIDITEPSAITQTANGLTLA